MTICTN